MSFDRIAPHYRWIEAISAGDKLQRSRVAWLDAVTHCQRVLIVGEGNGRFLEACAIKLPETHFTVVDGSAKMLSLAKTAWLRAGGKMANAEFIHVTMPGLKLPESNYDLIVTHFFLDCFDEQQLPVVIGEIASKAAPSCHWLLADFMIPAGGFRRIRASIIVKLLYRFFHHAAGLQTRKLICPADHFRKLGFLRAQHLEIDSGLLYSDLWTR